MTRRLRRAFMAPAQFVFAASFTIALSTYQAHRLYAPAVVVMVASGLLVTFFVATKGNQS